MREILSFCLFFLGIILRTLHILAYWCIININFYVGDDTMSIELQNDIKYAKSILDNECHDKFRKIYTNTNEDLSLLFSQLDLSDKNILTVLSSSDYLYMSYLFGAKRVDCFDINPLTFRLFYLRKWLINNNIIDIGFCSYEDVIRVLMNMEKTNTDNEKESLLFWKEVLSKMGESDFYHNQLFTTIFNPFNSFYKDKLVNLSKILSYVDPTFYSFDICDNLGINIGKRYDFIFLSNILDYNRSRESLDDAFNNLLPLVDEQGKIVCAHISQIANEDFTQVLDLEKKVFQNAFEYSHIIASDENQPIHYYQYTKK